MLTVESKCRSPLRKEEFGEEGEKGDLLPHGGGILSHANVVCGLDRGELDIHRRNE